MTEGWVYCLSNPSMPGLLKVGITERTPEERAKELSTTGVPTPFVIEFAKRVKNPAQKEATLHALLEKYAERTNARREFFRTTPEIVKQFFDLMDDLDGTVTDFSPVTEPPTETYQNFVKSIRPSVKEAHPDFTPQQIITEIGSLWQQRKNPTVEVKIEEPQEEEIIEYVQTRLDDSHYHVAKLLKLLYKREYSVYQEKELRMKLSENVVDIIVAARMRLKKRAWDEHCNQKGTGDTAPMPDEDFFKDWSKTYDGQRFTSLMKVEKHLYTNEFKNAVMREAKGIW
jgi:hypothetical protein